MRGSLLLSLGLLSQSVTAILLNERDEPAVVGFDLERRKVADPVLRERLRRKRDDTVSIDIVNPQDLSIYWINGTVGTPGQSVTLALDTGSSDMWVNVADSTYCSQSAKPCEPFGTYDHAKSSTYKFVDHNLNNTYLDNSGAAGDFVTDTVKFGGATLEKFQFGVAYQTTSNKGILGVSYENGEGIRSNNKYTNFPSAMVEAGYIKSPAFSLYLNDLGAPKGEILFGGVDTSKYVGELQSVPIVAVDGVYYGFSIILTDLALNKGKGKAASYSSSDFPLMVTLDCGSTFVVLPDTLAKEIYDDLDVKYNSTANWGTLPCSMKNKDWNLTYTFSGVDISIPISELVLDEMGVENDQAICLFGITWGGKDVALLGDPFLRSSYVVYDLGNNEISLAQANFNPGKEHILEIGTGSDAVPGATKVTSAVTTAINSQIFQSGDAVTVVAGTITATGTATGTAAPTGGSNSNSGSGSDSGSSTAATTSSSKGLAAAFPTNDSKHLVAGLAGAAGLLLAL